MKHNHANQLDEMQDRKLLQLEEFGFWIMFWALAASIAVQLLAGGKLREVAGELIVLLIGSAYICLTSLKNGIWTRKSAPTRKGNAIASLIPAALIGVLNVIRMKRDGAPDTNVLLLAAVITGTYAVCFAVLELFRAAYLKRRAVLDDVDGENGESPDLPR